MAADQKPPRVFKLTGEVDMARQAELDAIAAAVAEAELAIVDMTEVTFVDTTVINWLLRTKKVLEEKTAGFGWLHPRV